MKFEQWITLKIGDSFTLNDLGRKLFRESADQTHIIKDKFNGAAITIQGKEFNRRYIADKR